MKIKFGFITLGLLLQELLAFAKIEFPGFFSAAFLDFELKFGVSVYLFSVGVMPLKYLLGPVGDMYCLSNTFRMLVHSIWPSDIMKFPSHFSKSSKFYWT